MQNLITIIYPILKLLISFKNIMGRNRIVKAISIRGISHINSLYTIIKLIPFSRFLISNLSSCANPRVNHFVIGKEKCGKKSESVISSSKRYGKVDSKLKIHVSDDCHAGYKKSTVPQPHINGRMVGKLFFVKSNFIKPTLWGDLRFFDTLKFEIPPINQNACGQMHENCFKKITKTSKGNAHQKTQNHTLIAVEKRATYRNILSHWPSYSGHNLHSIVIYFTTFKLRNLIFFIFSSINATFYLII